MQSLPQCGAQGTCLGYVSNHRLTGSGSTNNHHRIAVERHLKRFPQGIPPCIFHSFMYAPAHSPFMGRSKKPQEPPVTVSDMNSFHDSISELDEWTNPHNIFDILRIGGAEIRHSNFLAWLLDPKGSHGTGSYFIERFLGEVQKRRDVGYSSGSELSDAVVYRELYSMDIVVRLDAAKLVIVIENKVHALESGNQLAVYQRMVEGTFVSSGFHPIYVFLTVSGDLPSKNEWIDLPYASIYPHLVSMKSMDLDERTRMYLDDYLKTIGVEMFMDEEMQKVCLEIYNKHAREIRLLNNFATEMYNKRTEKIEELLNSKPDVQFCRSGCVFNITTPGIREINSRISGDSSKPVYIQFINRAQEAAYSDICIIIGPGDGSVRRMCYDHLMKFNSCDNKRAFRPSYNRIYTEYVTFNAGHETLQNWIENTLRTISNFIDNFVPGFENYYSKIDKRQ